MTLASVLSPIATATTTLGIRDLGPTADAKLVTLVAPTTTTAAGFCDYWPESCLTVCEITTSGGTVCSLQPNWLPIAPSASPYAFIGAAHNEGLAGVSARSSGASLAQTSLASSYVTWLTADALCNGAAPSLAADPNWNATFGSSTMPRQECMIRVAGNATDSIYTLRSALATDGYGDEIAASYMATFRNLGSLNQSQLDAIGRLYALLPNESRINDVPLLFGRIDAFERDTRQRLSPQDAEAVLRTSAVMRASLAYWLDQAEGPTTWPAIDSIATEPPTARKKGLWRRILRLIAADAAGCLGGTLVGGVPGCVIGGIGASAAAGARS